MRYFLLFLASFAFFSCHPSKKAKIRPVSTQTDGPGVRRTLARALIYQKEYTEALRHLRRALKDDGGEGHPETHILIGISLREIGFYPEARKSLSKAISLYASSGEAWNALGLLEQITHNHEAAILAFKEACRLAPDIAQYHNNLGFSLYLSARFLEASQALRKAVTLSPGVSKYWNNLGFALGGLGDDEDAKQSFLASGSEAMAENNLGVILEKRGDLLQAKKYYKNALTLDPELTQAQQNFTRLENTLPTTNDESKRTVTP